MIVPEKMKIEAIISYGSYFSFICLFYIFDLLLVHVWH